MNVALQHDLRQLDDAIAGSFAQNNTTVRPGTHTVRTFLFTDFGADRSIFEIQYQLYRF